jgi:hypothetical protein
MGNAHRIGIIVQEEVQEEKTPLIIEYFKSKDTALKTATSAESSVALEELMEKVKHLPWKIPEVDALLKKAEEEQHRKTPPTSASGRSSGSGAPAGASAAPDIIKKIDAVIQYDLPQFKKNVDFLLTKNPGISELIALKTAVDANKEIKAKFTELIKAKPEFEKKLAYLIKNKRNIYISRITGGARLSRRNRKTPERQSYRRSRSRGNSTRKNHRPRKGE